MSDAASKEARTVAPPGWPVALLESLEADFGSRLEALVGETELPSRRLRPAASDAPAPDRIVVVVLDERGQPKEVAQAIADIGAAAATRGLALSAATRDSVLVTIAPPAVAATDSTDGVAGEAGAAGDAGDGSPVAAGGRRRRGA